MNPANAQGVAPPQAPYSLLQLIAQDADFRARLEADPVSAFAEHGIQVQAESINPSALALTDTDSESIVGQWYGLL